jgi:hypothetical protein
MLPLALALGGCSFSYQLDSLSAKKSTADLTGSVQASSQAAAEPPAEGDLAIARATATEVLSKGGKDASMPWENPSTGARGTITPLATAYDLDGLTCRDSWLQGEACRARGKWEVRNLRPMKKT